MILRKQFWGKTPKKRRCEYQCFDCNFLKQNFTRRLLKVNDMDHILTLERKPIKKPQQACKVDYGTTFGIKFRYNLVWRLSFLYAIIYGKLYSIKYYSNTFKSNDLTLFETASAGWHEMIEHQTFLFSNLVVFEISKLNTSNYVMIPIGRPKF